MKKTTIRSILIAFAVIVGSSFSISLNAQTASTPAPKVYVVINRADWCPTCKANGSKIDNDVISKCKDFNVLFITNDLTNKKTKAKSAKTLKTYDLLNAVNEIKSTGLMLLVDGKTKEIINQISVAEPTEDIIKRIKSAQEGI